MASPVGLLSDEEAVTSPVLESTVAECGAGLCRDLLAEFSAISSSSEQAASDDNGKVKVYARVRPLTPAEMEKQEDKVCVCGCACIDDSETLLLKAPKDSFTMRNIERGLGQAVHKFTFTQIFGPEVGQASFFDATMKDVVKGVLHGQNWLVYTYGVTNSGKTYTIQGSGADAGILPRSLAIIFNSIGTRLYRAMDLKPFLSSEVTWLDSKQVRQEEMKKQALLCGKMKEELYSSLNKSHSTASQLQAGTSGSIDSGLGGLSYSCQSANLTSTSQLEETGPRWADPDNVSVLAQDDVQFSIWVSFFEIYNEQIYDLLEMTTLGPNCKRPTLRLCEDQTGNPYVKDLNWINVQDAAEAWKLLKLGRRNQSVASTHMNQHSSRSHSIFSIRILHLQESSSGMEPKISEMSLCDLAGSERCKEQRVGDRLKEANNINTSLHTLGRCLTLLRQNQQTRLKQSVVPFRDSKLTRVFQGFFTGRGQSCMIVNINPCASSYYETLHVAKFSAIASQILQAPTKLLSIQSLIKEHSLRGKKIPAEVPYQEDELDEESEDEMDVTTYDKEDLLRVVEAVRDLLLKERQEKFQLEMRLRDEICNEMMDLLQKKEQWTSEHVDIQKEMLEDVYEEKLNSLKESLTDYYQEKIEVRGVKELWEEEVQEGFLRAGHSRHPVLLASEKLQGLMTSFKRFNKFITAYVSSNVLSTSMKLRKHQKMLEPPLSSKPITTNVDRKLEEGQKNVRMLRSELQKLGESLQSAERACCHSTGAGKLREALSKCDNILAKQDQTLAELQNNMMLVKMDLRKKAACIAEQFHTVQKLQAAPTSCSKKRFCANNENVQPRSQPPFKKPFLHNFLTCTTAMPAVAIETPYSSILRARGSPTSKPMAFGKKH
uniref:Kinesin-like protein n=1 Tax=Podarcis muralis TaxID=64176 RepID=A0A670HTJ3_PODMU